MNAGVTRKIVKIDEDKCDGCGLCVPRCAEEAIKIIDGKARLLAENLCDGLGACLGECPQGAITIEERPAEQFDPQAVERRKHAEAPGESVRVAGSGGCPGSMLRQLAPPAAGPAGGGKTTVASQLRQWPVQLALVPPQGPIWQDADVLFSADCVAYALGDFHQRLLPGKTLVVACPKLDDPGAYVAKLASVFARNRIRSITIAHMEVPCCSGLERIVRAALEQAGKDIPVTTVEVGIDGTVLATQGEQSK